MFYSRGKVRSERKKQYHSRTPSDAKLTLLLFCTVFRIGPESSLLQFSNILPTWLCHVSVVLIIFFSLFFFFLVCFHCFSKVVDIRYDFNKRFTPCLW